MDQPLTTLLEQYLISTQDPYSITAEQFRVLHARLEKSQKAEDWKLLCITSAVKGEGKTFTAANLALTMARDFGKQTLLMDVDCKKTVALKLAGQEDQEQKGWSDVVLKKSDLQEVMIPFTHEKLFFLPVGKVDRPSSSLITGLGSSGLLKYLRGQFDYVVLDAPPVLPLADMKLLEDLVDSVLLVVKAESTTRDLVVKAVASLKRDKLRGVVLNDLTRVSKHYFYYHHYDGNQTIKKIYNLRISE